ncbi:DUF6188 family protein [Streptomyces sp. NPDC059340]|uniref:DUF6188 family protein n=1 Tax=Streptomyces sp. NPDC059340 TaxID=3346806 RepID=UPI0036959DA3
MRWGAGGAGRPYRLGWIRRGRASSCRNHPRRGEGGDAPPPGFKSGTLCLVFDTGRHLNCSSDPSFEAWQVTGPAGWRFVSLPGGDLAVWTRSGASES